MRAHTIAQGRYEPRECPKAARAALPSVRIRTAFTISVAGWCAAKPCIQVGIVETGTNALETKVNGKTRNAVLWAAWGLPATNPRATNVQLSAKPQEQRLEDRAPACSARPRHRVHHHRETHRLERPLDAGAFSYPLSLLACN